MSLFELARDTLKEIPMADIMRARLELALDQSALQEKEMSGVREENAELKAELKIARLEMEKRSADLQRLRDEHSEEIRIHHTIEFRRGKRTGGKWMPFCPKCHLPVSTMTGLFSCSDPKCGWKLLEPAKSLPALIEELS